MLDAFNVLVLFVFSAHFPLASKKKDCPDAALAKSLVVDVLLLLCGCKHFSPLGLQQTLNILNLLPKLCSLAPFYITSGEQPTKAINTPSFATGQVGDNQATSQEWEQVHIADHHVNHRGKEFLPKDSIFSKLFAEHIQEIKQLAIALVSSCEKLISLVYLNQRLQP